MDVASLYALLNSKNISLADVAEENARQIAMSVLSFFGKRLHPQIFKVPHADLQRSVEASLDQEMKNFMRDLKSKIPKHLYPTVGLLAGQIVVKKLLSQAFSPELIKAILQVALNMPDEGPPSTISETCIEWGDIIGSGANFPKGIAPNYVVCVVPANKSPEEQRILAWTTGEKMRRQVYDLVANCKNRQAEKVSIIEFRDVTITGLMTATTDGPMGKLVRHLGWDEKMAEAFIGGLLDAFGRDDDGKPLQLPAA